MWLFKYIIGLPVIAFAILLTLNNMEWVTLRFYPFPWQFELPLILIIYISFLLGVISNAILNVFDRKKSFKSND